MKQSLQRSIKKEKGLHQRLAPFQKTKVKVLMLHVGPEGGWWGRGAMGGSQTILEMTAAASALYELKLLLSAHAHV